MLGDILFGMNFYRVNVFFHFSKALTHLIASGLHQNVSSHTD